MGQSLTCLHYHLVFSTKNRYPHIDGRLGARLYEYIGGIVKTHHGHLLSAGGIENHIHLLVALPGQTSVADAIRLIKSNSSKWIHETFPEQRKFAWQNGYGAFSVSRSNDDDVRRYIENQVEHHRHMTFEEEFIEFLRRHDLTYDERYVWD